MPDMELHNSRAAEEQSLQLSAQDLYAEQMEAYREARERGLDYANRRFGFVLYHSLPGDQAVQIRQQLGFQPGVATDYYNLGVVAAQQENYREAIKQFQKALEQDPELAEAEHNLALALELAGDLAGAKKQWSSYMKREAINDSDRNAVSEHVKELG